ncbi:MAG: GxxExxY protein [Nibricoccus sp.]
MNANSDKPLAQLGYDIMAAAFDVYNDLGGGLSEEIYQESMERALNARNIPFAAQSELVVFYKGQPLTKRLRPDLFIADEVVVEFKAVKTLAEEHEAQLLNYLRVTRKSVGYLINFAAFPSLQWKRFVNTRSPV